MAREHTSLSAVRNRKQDIMPVSERDILSPSRIFADSPWQMMRRMQEDMSRLFGPLLPTPLTEGLSSSQAIPLWSPSVDVSENDKEWRIEVDLPGVTKDKIDVQVQNGVLRIRAELRQEVEEKPDGQNRQYYQRERRYGYFERVFPLPENVNEGAIRCEARDGVLTCHLPKAAQSAQQARSLPINDGTADKASNQDHGSNQQTSGQQGTNQQSDGADQRQAANKKAA
jgi:HSP20 family protein